MSNKPAENPDREFNYMMLSRLKMDCDYFLGNGQIYGNHLHQGNVPDQIKYMKSLWNGFTEKPEWLTMEQIEEYEKKMLALSNPKT